MASFVVWNMSAAGDGTWKTVDAEDARSAAELVCGGVNLRSFGMDSEICARVRPLDTDDDAVLFYADKKTEAKAQKKKQLAPAGS